MHIKVYGILLIPMLLFSEAILMPHEISISGITPVKDNSISIMSDSTLNSAGLKKLRNNNFPDAEKYFTLAIIKNPNVKYYYNNLSVVYMNLERYDKAYDNLEKAIKLDPAYAKALSNMAITCFYMFNFIESYKYYIAARKADREYTVGRFTKKKAEKKIRELYRKNPGNENLKSILNRLENSYEDSI
ncbi:MAG: tetratricopeptide repeat protein [Spirochaetes bacterium]|nr:tetratricopeptide repeat protein [Spirochaetota bacterium]